MNRNLRAIIGIGIFIIIGMSLLSFLVWYYIIDRSDHPPNPVSFGNFPANPEWVFTATESVASTPVVYGSQVFIRSLKHVYALDSSSGGLLWQAESPAYSILSIAPAVTDCCLIVPEAGSRIAVFAVNSGKLLWRTNAIDINLKNPQTASIEALTTIDHLLYVARFDWKLTNYELNNSKIIWEANVPGRAVLNLAIGKTAVYLGSEELVRAYDSLHGIVDWEKDLDSQVGPILSDESRLYITLHSGQNSIVALDMNTHNEVWHVDMAVTGEGLIRSLVSENDILYAAANKLIAISKTDGSVKWISSKTGNLGKPVILGNMLYVRDTGTTLYFIDKTTGLKTGSLVIQADTPMQHQPERGPAVAGELLIIPFGDDRVFAYRP